MTDYLRERRPDEVIAVDPDSLPGQAAIVRYARATGFDVAATLPRDQWRIDEINGRAEVMISIAGLTALTKIIDKGAP